eukprot:CAMPEP_0202915864 /NCGR_PEP_ID=MMETSP1392-20130828/66919_1 /ASSEMBLY_ACC=CAM_ASM_000868 /TAXON_ID=225041 /ORGANISM="Chlamydomonas chlamydogama, Strain SAG 11-48b" /LENGTH=37 /DNA_ID= /DNA_START= /DNA_END= /DNA_ORIENTATION=
MLMAARLATSQAMAMSVHEAVPCRSTTLSAARTENMK